MSSCSSIYLTRWSEGVDRGKVLPAETSWRGGKWPRGVVRTFAGRTSAILGTRSAQPTSTCRIVLALSLSLFSSSLLLFFATHVYMQSEEVFPDME